MFVSVRGDGCHARLSFSSILFWAPELSLVLGLCSVSLAMLGLLGDARYPGPGALRAVSTLTAVRAARQLHPSCLGRRRRLCTADTDACLLAAMFFVSPSFYLLIGAH